MFVDVAGRTTEVIDANAREIMPAQIFVAVRGASGSTYADATFTQHARPIGSARMSGGSPSSAACRRG